MLFTACELRSAAATKGTAPTYKQSLGYELLLAVRWQSPLPKDVSISAEDNSTLTIDDIVYRCIDVMRRLIAKFPDDMKGWLGKKKKVPLSEII